MNKTESMTDPEYLQYLEGERCKLYSLLFRVSHALKHDDTYSWDIVKEELYDIGIVTDD